MPKVHFVGMDCDKEKIILAKLSSANTKETEEHLIANTPSAVKKYLSALLQRSEVLHYRSYHASSRTLLQRRHGVEPLIHSYANRAGRRLSRKYLHLVLRRKSSQVAITAASRELAGFLWGTMTIKVA